jgi:Cu/Ag efflux protein CusF
VEHLQANGFKRDQQPGHAAMSMAFQVKESVQMDALQIGQKVRFRAVQDKGAYSLLQIEAVGRV